MEDIPANPNISPRRYSPFWFRFWEIVPGVSVWIALLSPFLLAVYIPLYVTIFIIMFDVLWLQKAVFSAGLLYNGYRRMKKNLVTDWKKLNQKLSALSSSEKKEKGLIDPQDVYHAILLTTYKEEEAILDSSIRSVVEADYDPKKKILILATEGRDAEQARLIAKHLKEKYGQHFFLFMVTEHPNGIVGEVKGKGANADWAARELTKQVEKRHITLENVILSTADADSRFVRPYFQCLTYNYASNPDRVHCSYQPIATFLNNIWEAPMISRVIAFSTTFWQLTESIRDYRLLTFSTHAMSLRTLVDIDYWCTSVVNEDSRQFFRAYFHYHGNFRAIPLFMPVYMDAVHVKNFLGTMKNLYLQQQRWAYGVEHFPYIVMESFKQGRIPLLDRAVLVWRAYNGSFSWATSAFFISVVGWLPIVLSNSFRNQVLASNFPIMTSWLLTLTWIGIFAATAISFKLVPERRKGQGYLQTLSMLIQWVFVPPCTIIFGAIPGIDSQTRLMLGNYLGFRVTEKKSVDPQVVVSSP